MRIRIRTKNADQLLSYYTDAELVDPDHYDTPDDIVSIPGVNEVVALAIPDGIKVDGKVIREASLIESREDTEVLLEAMDVLVPYVSRNEYETRVKLNQSNLSELVDIASDYSFVYVDEVVRDEFDIPPSVTVDITIDLEEWHANV